jgi:peptidyl-prolyl cis-trans isomerase C
MKHVWSVVGTILLFALFAVPIYAGGKEAPLAKVNGKTITMDDFNRIISFYDADKQKLLEQNPQFKATVLQRIVQGMVVSKIAKDKGFDKRPDIKEQIGLLMDDFLASEYLKKEVVGKIKVAEDDMRLYYKMHKEDFETPEMVRARRILIKTDESSSKEDKKKAKEKAEEISNRIRAGEDFAKLASKFSDDSATKENGGDLGFISRGKISPDFEKVAFSLKKGEASGVVETPSGFQIIKVEEKKKAVVEPYDKIKDKIKAKLFAEFKRVRVAEFVQKAMKDSGAELDPAPFWSKK